MFTEVDKAWCSKDKRMKGNIYRHDVGKIRKLNRIFTEIEKERCNKDKRMK